MSLGATASESISKDGPENISSQSMRKSCEPCRTSKAKCQPGTIGSTRCQKCQKDDKLCVFAETKPRPKKSRTSKTRVAEMEQKLNGIFELLQSRKIESLIEESSAPLSVHPAPPQQTPIPTLGNSYAQVRETLMNISSNDPTSSFSLSRKKFDDGQDVIEKGWVSYEEAELFLEGYRPTQSNFPFVVIYPHQSLESLRRKKPFLLLAVLAVSAYPNLTLQARLDTEIKETLSRRVIMKGERSIELLQGLLIYLAWYHLFFDPESEQIYHIQMMVTAMAIDLGIHEPPRRKKVTISWGRETPCLMEPEYVRQGFQPSPTELESRRTFLGCYYVSIGVSICMKKPINLKHTDYMENCCQVLDESHEVSSDQLIPYFIQLERLKEDISKTFGYADLEKSPHLCADGLETTLEGYIKQLVRFKESAPLCVRSNSAIAQTVRFLHVFVHEIGLHASPKSFAEEFSVEKNSKDWFSSMGRARALLSCMEAAQDYIEQYLEIPVEHLQKNTMVDEMKLIYAVHVLGKFASGINTPHIDPMHLRQKSNITVYLDRLILRMEALVLTVDGVEKRNYFWFPRALFKITRLWYQTQMQGQFFTTMSSSGLPDCIDMNMVDSINYDTESGTPASMSAAHNMVWTGDKQLALLTPSSLTPPQKGEDETHTWPIFFDDPTMAMNPFAIEYGHSYMQDEGMAYLQDLPRL